MRKRFHCTALVVLLAVVAGCGGEVAPAVSDAEVDADSADVGFCTFTHHGAKLTCPADGVTQCPLDECNVCWCDVTKSLTCTTRPCH
jgi:hypothetical protein